MNKIQTTSEDLQGTSVTIAEKEVADWDKTSYR